MNKLYKRFCLICILVITFSLAACKEPIREKEIIRIDGQKVSVDETDWMERADLIFKGRVLEKKEPYFTNPDNKVFLEGGAHATNAYVTEYIVAIDELYKGKWSQETISVKTYNRKNLTVEQALYGEDENYIIESTIPDTEMQLGECIVGLSYFDASLSYADEPCYEITYGMAGYFLEQEDGTFANQTGGNNHFSIDPQTLPDKIANLKQ